MYVCMYVVVAAERHGRGGIDTTHEATKNKKTAKALKKNEGGVELGWYQSRTFDGFLTFVSICDVFGKGFIIGF